MRKWSFLLWVVVAALPVSAQYASQTIVLRQGWNAVYFRVTPQQDANTLFAHWPVSNVYQRVDTTFENNAQFSTDATTELVPEQPFLTWTKGAPDSLQGFLNVSGNAIYILKAMQTVTNTIYGRPVLPSMRWHTVTEANKQPYNYLGLSLSATGSWNATNYLNGAPAYTKAGYYMGDDDAPAFTQLTTPSSALLANVLVMDATPALGSLQNTWPGAFHVTPQSGLIFDDTTDAITVTIKNHSTHPQILSVRYDTSAATLACPALAGSPTYSAAPLKYWSVTSNDWLNLPKANDLPAKVRVWTNGVNQSRSVVFGLDRSQTVAGVEYAGILTITEDAAVSNKYAPSYFETKIPVYAKGGSHAGSAQNATWPAGLWVGTFSFTTVDFVDDAINGSGENIPQPAQGTLRVRALLHVDTNGLARLLQRVTLGINVTTNITSVTVTNYFDEVTAIEVPTAVQTVDLYANNADKDLIPSRYAKVLRISSAAMNVEGAALHGQGRFLSTLQFSDTLAADGASNPFRHAFHPEHDGMIFNVDNTVSPAPSGDVSSNYANTVKPETFSVSNTFTLVWSTSEAAASRKPTPAAWYPSSTTSGSCTWRMEGVRRQPITMQGTFYLQRINAVGVVCE